MGLEADLHIRLTGLRVSRFHHLLRTKASQQHADDTLKTWRSRPQSLRLVWELKNHDDYRRGGSFGQHQRRPGALLHKHEMGHRRGPPGAPPIRGRVQGSFFLMIRGPTLSPVCSLWAAWEPSQSGNCRGDTRHHEGPTLLQNYEPHSFDYRYSNTEKSSFEPRCNTLVASAKPT